MTEMKREEFTVVGIARGRVSSETANGYTFNVEFDVGKEWPVGVCKVASKWRVYDRLSGLSISASATGANSGFPTRREAVAFVESDAVTMKLRHLLDEQPHVLAARIAMLKKVVDEGPMTESEYRTGIAETALMIGEGTVQGEDVSGLFGSAAEVAAEVAAEISLSTMRAALCGWENVAVTQEKPQSLIWVRGETKPHKEELEAMGFGWSKSMKGWWIKPTAATW